MKPQVLVYYVNETAVSLRRLRRIEKRIKDLQNTKSAPFANRVREDLISFPGTTHRQLQELGRLIREHGKSSGLAGVATFDNESAKCGWFEYQMAGVNHSTKVDFPGIDASQPELEESPLCSQVALKAALREVARRFNPQDHEFILVTRSHGNEVMAMTIGLLEATLDLAAGHCSTEQGVQVPSFGEAGLGEAGLGEAGLGEAGLGEVGLGEVGLGEFGLGGKGLLLGGPELVSRGVGLTKSSFLEILGGAGSELGMEFSLVFMDSCGSEISREQAQEVPRNLHSLFGSNREGLGYGVPAYEALGGKIDLTGGIVRGLKSLLAATGNVIEFELNADNQNRYIKF